LRGQSSMARHGVAMTPIGIAVKLASLMRRV
jgi:hypothetical protein